MAILGGTDLSGILKAVQQGVGELIGGFRPETNNPALVGLGGQQGPDLWQGLSYGQNPTAWSPQGSDPMMGYQAPGTQPFAPVYGGPDLYAGINFGGVGGWNGVAQGPDLFADFQTAKGAADRAQQAAAQQQATAAGLAGGGTFSGPATSDDNKALTPEAIDNFIRSKFPNSPLAGQGAYILQRANALGVSVPLFLGIGWKESGMGTNVGAGNIFGITDPNRDQGLGGTRAFASYSGVQAEIDAALQNLASPIYKGKSAAEQIGAWYVGPDEYMRLGLAATDRAGNGTVGEYLNGFIAPVYSALGVQFNQSQAPTAVSAGGGGNWQQAGAALIGTPYGLGGRRAAGGEVAPGTPIDCSEFTAYLLEQEGITVTWNAQAQFNETQRVDRSQLQAGDLVFFQGTYDTGRGEYVTHVGRFIGYDQQGNPMMIHAGNGGVQYANLNDAYWTQHYAGAGRVAR